MIDDVWSNTTFTEQFKKEMQSVYYDLWKKTVPTTTVLPNSQPTPPTPAPIQTPAPAPAPVEIDYSKIKFVWDDSKMDFSNPLKDSTLLPNDPPPNTGYFAPSVPLI
jgi:hypothetical protein